MLELSISILESFPFPYSSIELKLPAIQIIPGIATTREFKQAVGLGLGLGLGLFVGFGVLVGFFFFCWGWDLFAQYTSLNIKKFKMY